MNRPDYAPPRGYNLALLRDGRMTPQEATDAMTRGHAPPPTGVARGFTECGPTPAGDEP